MRFLFASLLAVIVMFVGVVGVVSCGDDEAASSGGPPAGDTDGGGTSNEGGVGNGDSGGGGGGDGSTNQGPAPKGTLDPTFGTGGIVVLPSSHSTVSSSFALRQSDGKLIFGGVINSDGITPFLARYDTNDALDPTFGSGGVAIAIVGAGGQTCSSAALQPDGKIVVGCAGAIGSLRFDTNGALDKTYGNNGRGPAFNTSTVHVLPSGAILLAGSAPTATPNVTDFAVERLTSAGVIDTTFGTNNAGVVTTSFAPASAVARALAIDSTSRIVVVGKAGTKFALARYSADGVLDGTFGTAGTRITGNIGPKNDDGATSVIIQSDGKILVGGTPGGYSLGNDHLLARYDANGTALDASFGTSIYGTQGVRTAIIGQETTGTIRLALRPDGRVVALGAKTAYLWAADFASGTSYGASSSAGLSAVVALPDNTVVVAGSKDSADMANNVDYVRDLFYARLDTSVAAQGADKVLALNAGSETIMALAVAPDGTKIFAAQSGTDKVAGITCLDNATGQPVPSFGNAGKYLVSSYKSAYVSASLSIDSAGGLLLQDFSDIRRVTPAGALDTAWGTNGITQAGNYAGLYPEATGTSLVLWTDATMHRLNALGKWDATFASPLPTPPTNSSVMVGALVRQADGSYVVPGYVRTTNVQPERRDAFVARVDATGKVDTTFGVQGAFTKDLDAAIAIEQLVSAAPAPNNSVVAVGFVTSAVGASTKQSLVIRLTSAGVLDASFGQGGVVKGPLSGASVTDETINAVAVQSDGRVLVAGARAGAPTDLFVARLTASGAIDTTFAQNGVFTYAGAAGGAERLSLGTDGKLLVGGHLYRPATHKDAVLLRIE